MPKTVSILITGKVQGVFYRKSAREKALAAGLRGQVKNLPDGSVQAIATGEPEQLASFITWCKQGPPRAIVSNVTVSDLEFQSFKNFEIVR
ncbi:acylphosphatase [Terrimonas sp. NA20]|uniref:acylphosphatase n=1 Tax=Terrimonas ginsenosidimutans TaxID=2908004 RepID=A0ABS9KY42_9BACT|nr:acylphosphatase [Terrimonas ginsenosidimutans]MCG2617294.1 acylphosphatase [Terrimonas ginsenosidimutans]